MAQMAYSQDDTAYRQLVAWCARIERRRRMGTHAVRVAPNAATPPHPTPPQPTRPHIGDAPTRVA